MNHTKLDRILNEIADLSLKVLDISKKMTIEQAQELRDFLLEYDYNIDCCIDCTYNLIIAGIIEHTRGIA